MALRVYDIAKELGIDTKDALAKLEQLGEYVKSGSSTIAPPVAKKLRDAFPNAKPKDEPKAAPAKPVAEKVEAPVAPAAPNMRNRGGQIAVVAAGPHQAAQVVALAGKQAEVELALGGQAGAAAITAKSLGDAADDERPERLRGRKRDWDRAHGSVER